MKKKIARIAMISAIAIIAGWNYAQSAREIPLSNLTLSNVEALAQESGSSNNCRWSADWTVCNSKGNGLGCPCGSDKW